MLRISCHHPQVDGTKFELALYPLFSTSKIRIFWTSQSVFFFHEDFTYRAYPKTQDHIPWYWIPDDRSSFRLWKYLRKSFWSGNKVSFGISS